VLDAGGGAVAAAPLLQRLLGPNSAWLQSLRGPKRLQPPFGRHQWRSHDSRASTKRARAPERPQPALPPSTHLPRLTTWRPKQMRARHAARLGPPSAATS
jgi:hypothetical protein